MRVRVTGLVTEEIRERGRRTGFSIERFGGERGVLASRPARHPMKAIGRMSDDVSAAENRRAAAGRLVKNLPLILVVDATAHEERARS